MSIRVLIADDHPIVRDGLRLSLERSGRDVKVVGEAANGVEVLELAKIRRVDVFILDITMPRLNGLDTARELLKRRSTARIIILSLHDSRALVEESMEVGARGYLTKETASRNVTEAVCEVYAGRFYLSPEITHIMVERHQLRGGKRGVFAPAQALTAHERRVLQLIAEGRTTKEIATELCRSIDTVHTHRKNLMAKLEIHKETDLVRYAVKEGISKL
jgi:DNA-binding NarL/FixJ family response regulator